MRDEFRSKVKDTLARRVGTKCSNPTCRKSTSGPHDEVNSAVNIGVAAHITAAALSGPRYDKSLSSEERRSIENGIWLCQNCAKLVDSDSQRFTARVLETWKKQAEERQRSEIERSTEAPLSQAETDCLSIGTSYWTGEVTYTDHTGTRRINVFEVDVHNRHNEVDALDAIARLKMITPPHGVKCGNDGSPLKIVGRNAYKGIIWCQSHIAWDLFAVSLETLAAIFLNSERDAWPRNPVINAAGEYVLSYEIRTPQFRAVEFEVKLSVRDDPLATSAILPGSETIWQRHLDRSQIEGNYTDARRKP